MRKSRITPLGTNTFAVRVDSYASGEMKGEFCAPSSVTPVAFTSLTGLILMIDELLDNEDGFAIPVERPHTSSFDPNIEIEVLFRQNHSWQGRVRWLSEGREATFRSVLELLIVLQTIFGD